MALATPSAALETEPAERLIGLIAALATPRGRIETIFLDVGRDLGEASLLLNRIVAAFEALPRDLESAEMSEAGERLARFVARARDIAEAFAREKGDVERLRVAVGAATHPIDDLRRAVRLMGILAVNARIVAAGLADAADQFDVFTTDIAELSKSATAAVAAFADGHGRLAAAVNGAASQFGAFEAAHRARLAGLAHSLDRGLQSIAERRHLSVGRSAETLRVSQEMANRVGSAVMALQVGDSTRQRIQHSEEVLGDLAAWLAAGAAGDIRVEAGDRPVLAAILLELQQRQLRATGDAFAHETREAERALIELARDAEAAIADCRRLYGGDAAGSPVAALGAELREAASLLRDCAVEREKLDALAATVGSMVDVLLGHIEAVQEIEANMRLVGLNAAVKCAQLGPRGAALSVIAHQLRELTGELVPAARAAVARLGEAVTVARAFTAASGGRLAAEVGRLETEATASLGLLETVDGRLRGALATLAADGEQATTLLATAARGLSDHAGLAEALADVEIEISAIVPAEHGEATAAVADALKAVRRRYSMEPERRIHDALVAERIAADAAPPAPAEDEVLF
jgi:hypothetical protein